MYQGPGNGDLDPLPLGKLAGAPVNKVGHIQPVHKFLDTFSDVGISHAMQFTVILDIFPCRHARI